MIRFHIAHLFIFLHVAATSLSLVCRRWRRVAVPVIYESVILTSKSQAKNLVSMLRHVGPYIKKLRIEGGYGHSIHTILSKIPGLIFICVSLDIRSKQKAGGLCGGLKFINPKHVVLRDSKALYYQEVSNVIDVLIECMTPVWSNLVGVPLDMFCFPHVLTVLIRFHTIIRMISRTVALARSLARIPKLQTVYVPRSYFVWEDGVVLNAIKNRSLQRIYGRVYWIPGISNFEPALETHPRLRDVVHLPYLGHKHLLSMLRLVTGTSEYLLALVHCRTDIF